MILLNVKLEIMKMITKEEFIQELSIDKMTGQKCQVVNFNIV